MGIVKKLSMQVNSRMQQSANVNYQPMIDIINYLDGGTDTTYPDAISSLLVFHGGSAGTVPLTMLNLLSGIFGGATNYTSNLAALNGICVLFGGVGGWNTELKAWEEIKVLRLVKTVEIGDYRWTNKNFSEVVTAMGNTIPYIADNTEWINLTTPGWCYVGGNSSFDAAYGKLYNWYAIKLIQDDILAYNNLHPDSKWGYEVPVTENWVQLRTSLGGESVAGGKMKELGKTYWASQSAGTTNSSGFNGRGAGYRSESNGVIGYRTVLAGFWQANENNATTSTTYQLGYLVENLYSGHSLSYSKKQGLSLRLIKSVGKGLILGDSTSAAIYSQNPVKTYLLSSADKLKGNTVQSIAVSGHTCALQKTAYLALTNKAMYNYVVVMLGINDIGLGVLTFAKIIAGYQDLIDTIRANSNANCKIILATMTPCKGGIGSGYTNWLLLNEAIQGNGATPITGGDAICTTHTDDLNDGAGNLAAPYEIEGVNDHTHENNDGRIIVAAAWRASIAALNLL